MATKTQATAPLRSLDQRMEALARANDIRVRRAQLKKDLKVGSVQIEEILNDAEFVRRVDRGDFLEHVTYVSGKRYGTLRSEVDRIAAAGRVPVLELETEGALTVKEQLPRGVTIFITAPIRELERRLRER